MASLFDRSRWTALTAATLLIIGCGGGEPARDKQPVTKQTVQPGSTKPKPAATRAPSDSEQLTKLLTERAYAIEQGDAEGFLSTSTGAQETKDKHAIKRAATLPLNDVQMTARGTEVDGDRATLRVDMVYSFDGLSTQYVKTSRMSAARTPEGWRIAKDRPSDGALAPWELTTYKARTSRHFIALAPKSLQVGSLMKDLEKGRAQMQRGLPGVAPPDRLLVIVARNGNDTKALTKDLKTLSSLVAVAEAQVSLTGPARRVADVAGQRVFVLWRSYGNRSVKERRMVIAHELTHAALVTRTGGRVPPWLVEGIAMYASGDKRAGDAGALLSGGQLRDQSKQQGALNTLSLVRLARPSALKDMSAVSLSFAYSYSSAAAYAIAEKHGGGKALLRLYSAFNSTKIKGKPGRKLTDRVMRKTLGTSLSSVEHDIKSYARANSVL